MGMCKGGRCQPLLQCYGRSLSRFHPVYALPVLHRRYIPGQRRDAMSVPQASARGFLIGKAGLSALSRIPVISMYAY